MRNHKNNSNNVCRKYGNKFPNTAKMRKNELSWKADEHMWAHVVFHFLRIRNTHIEWKIYFLYKDAKGGYEKFFPLSPNATNKKKKKRKCLPLMSSIAGKLTKKKRKKWKKWKTHANVKCKRYWKQKVEANQKRQKKRKIFHADEYNDNILTLSWRTQNEQKWTKWTLNRSQLHYLLLLLIFAHKSSNSRSRTEYLCLIKMFLERLLRLLGALSRLCNFNGPKPRVE